MKLSSYLPLIRKNFSQQKSPHLYILGVMILFFGLFDASLSFIAPIAVTELGLSKTSMGIVLGSSSFFGGIFDILLSKVLKNTHFRRMYLLMFLFCFLCLFVLWNASHIYLFFIVMALWGIYFDLSNFGNFDYVSTELPESEHARGFGVIWIFRSLGYTVAPILIGAVIGETLSWRPFALMAVFISIAFCCYLILIVTTRKIKKSTEINALPKRYIRKHVWGKLGKILLPVLLMTMMLWITDSFFWTIGPLMSESFSTVSSFKGLFVSAYTLPPLLIGWFVGNVTHFFGKKKASYYSLLAGGVLLSFLYVIHDPLQMLCLVFAASSFFAISLPAVNAAYADYIHESHEFEKDIEGLEDLFTNIGYVIGPVIAGVLADSFGNAQTFSILGVMQAILAPSLILLTPKKINIRKSFVTEE